MPGGLSVDLRQLGAELALVDRRFATAVRRQVRAAVTEAGAAILEKVRAEASWSSRIPAATRLRTSFSARRAGVTVATSARQAPEARPLEMGNKGGSPGTLRHPVYGRPGRWASQPTRPYFFKAADEATAETEAVFRAAIDKAVREAGFH